MKNHNTNTELAKTDAGNLNRMRSDVFGLTLADMMQRNTLLKMEAGEAGLNPATTSANRAFQTQATTPPMPAGTYNAIIADPAWRYDSCWSNSRRIENQYPTMSLTDIKNLQIPADDNAVLYLWATTAKLVEALEVMAAWGFTYKSSMVWDKEKLGMGFWARGQHEFLLIGTRGRISPPAPDKRVSSVYREKRGKHSEKPSYFNELLEKQFPNGKFLELFARRKYSDKWTVWGNEAPVDVSAVNPALSPVSVFDSETMLLPLLDRLSDGGRRPLRIAIHDAEKDSMPEKVFANLVLMKISKFHKDRGDTVEWFVPGEAYDLVYSSKVFSFTETNPNLPLDVLQGGNLVRGGTGYELFTKLPPEIDSIHRPDYSIYPECEADPEKKTALGFITRGCCRDCDFCLVRKKEGSTCFYAHVKDIARDDADNITLMDNNVLSYKGKIEVLKSLINCGKKVDFNQGQDARLVTPEIADIYMQIPWQRCIRFSCDSMAQVPHIKRVVKLLTDRGFPFGNIFVYFIVRRDLREAAQRIEALKAIHPKIYLYAQAEQNPALGITPTPAMSEFAQRYVNMTWKCYQKETWETYCERNGFDPYADDKGLHTFGYVSSWSTKPQFIQDPNAAQTIQRIFTEFATGHSTATIAKSLNSEGIETPHAQRLRLETQGKDYGNAPIAEPRRWSPSSVTGVLRHEVYVGKLINHATGIVDEVATEPLVSQELWDEVQALLDARGSKNAKTRAATEVCKVEAGSESMVVEAVNTVEVNTERDEAPQTPVPTLPATQTTAPQAHSNYRLVDLFCGAGGMSLGFQNVGFGISGAFEYWKPAADTHDANFIHPVHRVDLSNVANAVALIKALNPDIIVGSPPCTAFSKANQKPNPAHAALTVSYAKIIAAVLPKYFVMENVKEALKTPEYAILKKMLTQHYGITELVLNAAYYGVPQARERLIVIGVLGGKDGALSGLLAQAKSPTVTTMRDYFGGTLGTEHYYAKPPNRAGLRRSIFSIDEPSATIRSVYGNPPKKFVAHKGDSCPLNPSVRPLTTLERASVQTFPLEFKWVGNKSETEKMIGNAVPVKLAEAVARCILEYDKAQAGSIPAPTTTSASATVSAASTTAIPTTATAVSHPATATEPEKSLDDAKPSYQLYQIAAYFNRVKATPETCQWSRWRLSKSDLPDKAQKFADLLGIDLDEIDISHLCAVRDGDFYMDFSQNCRNGRLPDAVCNYRYRTIYLISNVTTTTTIHELMHIYIRDNDLDCKTIAENYLAEYVCKKGSDYGALTSYGNVSMSEGRWDEVLCEIVAQFGKRGQWKAISQLLSCEYADGEAGGRRG